MRQIKARSYSDSNRPQLKWVVNSREDGRRKRMFFQPLADELGLKRRTIKTLRNDGKIPFVKLGDKTIRIEFC